MYNIFVIFLLGLYAKAEPLYVQCLDARKSKLGPDHPDTLQSMGNLAALYCNQGNHKYLNEMQKYCAIYETKH